MERTLALVDAVLICTRLYPYVDRQGKRRLSRVMKHYRDELIQGLVERTTIVCVAPVYNAETWNERRITKC